ncbi:MAG: hypothetical protein PWP51_2089 [Clostridiales bacterium]|jgi:uncharacterized membrane protein YgaE (UPF0421/DUF939 family)|nr:hypothetical protein [Clostridiales bacterium]MDN5299536.1 hypothetical protein [Clostridiales bacterium]
MLSLNIGMRTIKTVIAIALTIAVCTLLNVEAPFIATLTAFFCLQSTIVETSEMAIKRGGGTIVGGLFSLIYLTVVPNHLAFIPLGILLIILVCNGIHRNDFIPMAGVVFLVISFNVNGTEGFEPLNYVLMRVAETFLGISIAILVNRFIKPPNPFVALEQMHKSMLMLLEAHIPDEGDIKRVRNIEAFRVKIHEMRLLIQLFHKERNRERYHIDIARHMQLLSLYRTAYSHLYILGELNGSDLEHAMPYHGESLRSIKAEIIETYKGLNELQ